MSLQVQCLTNIEDRLYMTKYKLIFCHYDEADAMQTIACAEFY